MTSTTIISEPKSVIAAIAKNEGEARWFLGALSVIKLTGAMTGGRLAAVEFTEAPGGEPPLHLHRREDEVFCLTEGEIDFQVGEKRFTMKPGDIALAPKNIPHAYKIRSPQARWLILTFPAGFDDFVRDGSAPARELRLPRPGEPQGDMANFPTIGARHGIEFV